MESRKLILSDTQIPYHHRRAIQSVFGMLADRANSFEEVHQIGDTFDNKAVSRWVKGTPAENGKSLQKEIDSGVAFSIDLRKAWGGILTRIPGNHDEVRHAKYQGSSAPAYAGIAALEYEHLMRLAEFGWITKEEPYLIAPGTVAVHGMAVRKYSGYTAHAHLERLDSNVVHGHTHRGGIVYRTIGDRTRWAMEVGCLMDKRQADYVLSPDWQMGFGVLHIHGGHVQPEFVHIKADGSFLFDGRRWTA